VKIRREMIGDWNVVSAYNRSERNLLMAKSGRDKNYLALPWLEARVFRRNPIRAKRINWIFWGLMGFSFVGGHISAFFIFFM